MEVTQVGITYSHQNMPIKAPRCHFLKDTMSSPLNSFPR